MSSDGEERRLLVRGFPHWLRASEKTSLLRHFGATEVVALPSRGKMRNCAFATFASHEEARRALGKLHQLQVLRSRLVVEFAQDKHSHLLQEETHVDGGREVNEEAPPSPKPATPAAILPPPPPAPRLSYQYPPPSPSTLTNITHTLATIPKFYEQVLHLMNLMNLPPPFGPITATPPGLEGGEREEEEEGGSEPESEVGSDEGTRSKRPTVVREVKRRSAHVAPSRGLSPPAKRRRSSSTQLPQFDTTSLLVPARRISLNVPSKIQPRPPDLTDVVSTTTISATSSQTLTAPPHSLREGERERVREREEGEREEVEGEQEQFITSRELAQNRLSEREMQEASVFRGYSAGEPSLRLYIKNLSRQTTEQDLRYVYGRYIDWSSERERTVFDVRLMQTGRMKGQAFVGLPSEEVAARALRDTNGYQLAGRPLVVHFARTAKAKSSQ